MTGNVPHRDQIQESRGHSLLRNGLYNISGQTVRGAVGLLTIPFLIRFLGIREYGVWSLAYAVLALMTLSEWGISVATTVFLSKDLAGGDSREASKTLTFVLLSGVVVSIALGMLLWFSAPLIVRPLAAFGGAERAETGSALQMAAFAVLVFIPQRILVGVEQAFNRYAVINALESSQSLLANLGLVAVAWLGGRAVAMMKWQLLVWALLLCAHCCFAFRLLRGKGLSFQWSSNTARRILRFSTAAWFSALGSAAFGQCDRLVVGGILGAPVLGVYAAVTNITAKINSFSGTAIQPLVPWLSHAIATNTELEGRVRQAVQLNALIAIQAGIFLCVLADWVMRIMVPEAANPQGILALQIAAIIYVLYSTNAPGYFILFSVGDARTNAIVTLSGAAASMGLILVGAHYFGLLGAIAGNVGYVGTCFMTVIGLKRVGVALRSYLAWVALPSISFAAALIVGGALAGHLVWRGAFVAAQGVLVLLWFLRGHGKAAWTEFGLEQVFGG
jgi:O-antigen/teichoic acid export membrane protein